MRRTFLILTALASLTAQSLAQDTLRLFDVVRMTPVIGCTDIDDAQNMTRAKAARYVKDDDRVNLGERVCTRYVDTARPRQIVEINSEWVCIETPSDVYVGKLPENFEFPVLPCMWVNGSAVQFVEHTTRTRR
jgi:hypothetical protein